MSLFMIRMVENSAAHKQIEEKVSKTFRAMFGTVRSSLYTLIQNAFTDSDCF
jgi:hypothetical protein